ncbi:MAG: diaminopimelate epimerase [Woeseiaceae bacterium]|nr:diaminopimelate epimerase [Woeseiaceae bacterium]
MQLRFLKMEGAGNRILVVDGRREAAPPPAADTIRRLGDEATGPGFDQLMWLAPATANDAALSYRVFNADGSEVEQCGNGVRCVAWLLADEDGTRDELLLEGPVGPVRARVLPDGRVTVDMGRPRFAPEEIPFVAEREAPTYALEVDGEQLEVSVLSMGNPHCVLEVDDVEAAAVGRLGPLIERHERFPERVNAGFMQVVDRDRIALRVHERGVGETLACGTGACAAVVAGSRLDRLDDEVAVDLPGGRLVVSWRRGDAPVWLTGSATFLSEGRIDV